MKKMAAGLLALVLLSGCSAQPSEEWLAAKHECIAAGWSVNQDRVKQGQPERTFTEIEKHCNEIADKKAEKASE